MAGEEVRPGAVFPASALPPYGPSKSHACVRITDSKEPPRTGRNSELYFTAGEIEAQRVSVACCPSQSELVGDQGPELWSLESVHCSFPSPWNVH